MKRKLQRLVTVCMAACLLVMASGCGNENVAQESGGKTKVKMWLKLSDDSLQSVKDEEARKVEAIKEKFPNIEFDISNMTASTDYRQEYDKALMAGNAPDFFPFFSYTDIPARIKNNTVADITEFVDAWDLKQDDKVLKTFDAAISQDGNWYAIPCSAYVQGTLCNLKAIREGGGDTENLPETWEEFANMGAQITDLSVPRYGYELVGMDWCAWPYTAWVWSAGGEMVRPNGDGTYQIAFNEAPGVDAAMFLNQMVWEHKMTQKNILNSYADIMNDIVNGTAAFSWASLTDLSGDTLNTYGLTYDDFTMMPMPVKDSSIERPVLSGGDVITFNPKASQETLAAAFEVATYIYYDEERLISEWQIKNDNNIVNILMPPRTDLIDKQMEINTILSDETKQAIVEMTNNAIAEPFCPNWTDLKAQLVNPLQEILLTENISREKVQELLDNCAEELYKLYPGSFQK